MMVPDWVMEQQEKATKEEVDRYEMWAIMKGKHQWVKTLPENKRCRDCGVMMKRGAVPFYMRSCPKCYYKEKKMVEAEQRKIVEMEPRRVVDGEQRKAVKYQTMMWEPWSMRTRELMRKADLEHLMGLGEVRRVKKQVERVSGRLLEEAEDINEIKELQDGNAIGRLMIRELERGLSNGGLTNMQRRACEYWMRNTRGLEVEYEKARKRLGQLVIMNRIGERKQQVEDMMEALSAAMKELKERTEGWMQLGIEEQGEEKYEPRRSEYGTVVERYEPMRKSTREERHEEKTPVRDMDRSGFDDGRMSASYGSKGFSGANMISAMRNMPLEEIKACGYKEFCRWCCTAGQEYRKMLDKELEEKCQSFLRSRNVAQHVFDLLKKIPIPRWLRVEKERRLGFEPVDFDTLGQTTGIGRRVDCVQFFNTLYAAAHTANLSPMKVLSEIQGGSVFKGELADEMSKRRATGDFETEIEKNRGSEETLETDVVAWGLALYQFSILFTEAFGVKMDPAILVMEVDRFQLSDESPQAFERSLMELRYLIAQAGVTELERELYQKFKVKTMDMPRIGRKVAEEVERTIHVKQCMGVRNVQYERNFLISTVAQIIPKLADQENLNSKGKRVVKAHGMYTGGTEDDKGESSPAKTERSGKWRFTKCDTCGFKHYVDRFCSYRDDRKKEDGTYLNYPEFNGYKPGKFVKIETRAMRRVMEDMEQNSSAWRDLSKEAKNRFLRAVADAKEEEGRDMRRTIHHVRVVDEAPENLRVTDRGGEESKESQQEPRVVSVAHMMTSPAQDRRSGTDTLTWWCGEAQVNGVTIPMAIHVDGGSDGAFMHEGLAEMMGLEMHEYPREQQYLVVGATGPGGCTERVSKYVHLCMRIDGVEYYGELMGELKTGRPIQSTWERRFDLIPNMTASCLWGGAEAKELKDHRSFVVRTPEGTPVIMKGRSYAETVAWMARTRHPVAEHPVYRYMHEIRRANTVRKTGPAYLERVTLEPNQARMVKVQGYELPDIATTRVEVTKAQIPKERIGDREMQLVEVAPVSACTGTPEVMVANWSNHRVTVGRKAVQVRVIPEYRMPQFWETTSASQEYWKEREHMAVKKIHSVQSVEESKEDEEDIRAIVQEDFPVGWRRIWNWMSPEDQKHYLKIRKEYPTVQRRQEAVSELIDLLDIYHDYTVVSPPWEKDEGPGQVLDWGEEEEIEESEMEEETQEEGDLYEKMKRKEKEERKKMRKERKQACLKDGEPTQFAFMLARCIAYMNAIIHPDPDNPRMLKDYETSIETLDEKPIIAKPRRYSEIQRAFMKAKARIGKREGKVEDAKPGGWASALVLVPYHDRIEKFMKKWGEHALEAMWDPRNEEEVATFYRQTIDCRELNEKTKPDVFPLPRIDDLLDQIKMGTKHFSTGDIKDAFWVVNLAEHCRHKFAYRTHDEYLQPTRMVQGGRNSGNDWARIVKITFASIHQDEGIVYQDDVAIHSRTFKDHYRTLGKVFRCLEARDLTFKRSKMHINHPRIAFLGYIIDEHGKYPNPEAVKAIRELAYPQDVKAVRSFIGMTIYYRNFIDGYAEMVAPLHELTRKGVVITERWGERHEKAVDELKEALTTAPCLMLVDNRKPFEIRVDACRKGHGMGAVMLQPDEEENRRPVGYWSKGLTATEREYAPTEIECKALHDCLMYWDVYVRGALEVDVYTDHNCLVYMYKGQTASNNGRLMRYLLDLMGLSFRLHYKQGTKHMDADAVSRLLQRGEEPVYLTADDLEWDKGTVTEEDLLLAKDLEMKRRKMIERAQKRKKKTPERSQDKEKQENKDEEEVIKIINALTRRRNMGSKMEGEENMKKYLKRFGKSDRVLRPKKKGIEPVREAPHRADWETLDSPEDLSDMRRKRKKGYNRVKVLKSTIEGAGEGLFATKYMKEGSIVCDYEGERPSQDEIEKEEYDKDYVFSVPMGGGEYAYIDARDRNSCYGRYCNDPIDDSLVNARVKVKGKKLLVIATTTIRPGDEIFLSYGVEYWKDRLHLLTSEQSAKIQQESRRKKIQEQREERSKKTVEETSGNGEERVGEAAKTKAIRVKEAVQGLSELEEEKYVYDNQLQCPELAEKLQYLVGKKFIDDENGQLYEVQKIFYSHSERAVLGYRRSLTGKAHKYDDDPFYVHGPSGLLMLTNLYDVEHEDDDAKWPTTPLQWRAEQMRDEQLREWDKEMNEGEVKEVEKGLVISKRDMGEGVYGIHRRWTPAGRTIWQRWVPERLKRTCIKIFHEGLGHAGATRAVNTMALHYYGENMKEELGVHCRTCISCKLRQAYYRRPKVPTMEYPEVKEPMERLHIDLVVDLPETDNGNKHILVCKDSKSKFVWLFPLADKEAESVAQALVKGVYNAFGVPKMVVSDRGREFRNQLDTKLAELYRIHRVCTTPQNPRSNGLVENMNKTLKDQLHHYINARQSDWDVFLTTVQLMYNSTVNAATGYTPFYMMFGRESSTPERVGMCELEEQNSVMGEERDVDEAWVDKLTTALQWAWVVTTQRTRNNWLRMNRDTHTHAAEIRHEEGRKDCKIRHLPFKEYQVGDLFFRRRCPVRAFSSASDKEKYKVSMKLQPRFEGPYKVTKRINPVLYETMINGKTVRVHATNMKPDSYVERPIQVSD